MHNYLCNCICVYVYINLYAGIYVYNYEKEATINEIKLTGPAKVSN